MGGQTGSQMGGAATPQTTPTQGIQANMGPGSMGAPAAGGFDLSKLFAGNMPTNPAGGGQQLPQITAPVRPPMPTMPVRTPMPMPAASILPQTGPNFIPSPGGGGATPTEYAAFRREQMLAGGPQEHRLRRENRRGSGR